MFCGGADGVFDGGMFSQGVRHVSATDKKRFVGQNVVAPAKRNISGADFNDGIFADRKVYAGGGDFRLRNPYMRSGLDIRQGADADSDDNRRYRGVCGAVYPVCGDKFFHDRRSGIYEYFY